jgi:hypothetical protein
MRRRSGVLRPPASPGSVAIAPISVFMPVAVTTDARPRASVHVQHVGAVAERQIRIVETVDGLVDGLRLTGQNRFGHLQAGGLHDRPSAGTESPASSNTMSPGRSLHADTEGSPDQSCWRALSGRGTTMTGRWALRSVALTTLPRRISRTAERPREPMTITAAFRSLAHAISASAMARA